MSLYTPPKKTLVGPTEGSNPTLPQSDLSRILPRQLSTGSTRGTQTVGYGKAKLDGTKNRIVVGGDSDSLVGIGNIPGTDPVEFGFFLLNSNGILTQKIVNGTTTWYDDSGNIISATSNGSTVWYDTTGLARVLIGQAPLDGRIGVWVSKPTIDVVTELS